MSVPETFNKRVINTVDTKCWKLTVTNYGEKKSSFDFYTRSEKYSVRKKEIILKMSPDAIIDIEEGHIRFVKD